MAQGADGDGSDFDDLLDPSDEITERFGRAADHLKSLISSKIDNGTLLTLYGYYKQALEGPCNTSKPSWYDTKGKAKWEAWNTLGSMPRDEAKSSYVQLVESLDPNFTSGSTSAEKTGWVSVSTLQSSDRPLNDSEKSLADHVKEGNHETVKAILKSHKRTQVDDLINQLDDEGLGLIHWAADRGSPEMLKTVIGFGADVNLVDTNMQTALHYAASCGHADCVSVLLKSKANVNLKDDDGLKPIEVADCEVVKELLSSYS